MSKNKLIKIIEQFQSLLRKIDYNPEEISELPLPGHPHVYTQTAMMCLYLVMVLKGIKSFRGLYNFISDWENRYVAKACGFDAIPSRDTIRRRIQKMQTEFQQVVAHIGNHFVEIGIVDPRHVAVDSRMFEALGPKWHKKYRKNNEIPKKLRGVDTDSTWKKSHYRGWVQGYALNVVCIATKGQLPLPILARSYPNKDYEGNIFRHMIYQLPACVRFVLADEAYDNKDLYNRIERTDEQGHLIRRLVVPIEKESIGIHTPEKRIKRMKFANSTRGRKIYSRRMPSVECIFSRLIEAFDAQKVWFKGEHYNLPFLVLLVLAYQVLVYFRFVQGYKNITHVKPLIQSF